MQALEALNMYLLVDIPSQHICVDRKAPAYSVDVLAYFKAKVDAFVDFPNTLAFLIGNEIDNAPGNVTQAAAYVKAQLRDIRRYIKSRPRQVPVGYAAVDDDKIRLLSAQYFHCGGPDSQARTKECRTYLF